MPLIDIVGNLWTIGLNDVGQLGLGDRVNRYEITQATTDIKFIFVSCGQYHTAVVDSKNNLWMCGSNNEEQLGRGAYVKQINSLTHIRSGIETVACGYGHTTIIDINGNIWITGNIITLFKGLTQINLMNLDMLGCATNSFYNLVI